MYMNTRWRRLYCVFTYIFSLLIEKDICVFRKFSVKLTCVYVCFSSGDLFIFSIYFLFSYSCFILTFVLSPSKWSIYSVFY
jgi:hypothetical protein